MAVGDAAAPLHPHVGPDPILAIGPSLVERKRRIYLFSMLLALPALPVAAVLRGGEEVGAVLRYVLLGLLLAGLTLALWRRWVPVAAAEKVVLTVLPALVVIRLAATWLDGGDPAQVQQLAVETDGPTLLAIVLVCYLAFDNRLALRWAIAICAAFTLAVLPAIVVGAAADPGAAIALVRQVLVLVVVTALASFLAGLKGVVAAERARAEASERLARTDPLTGALNRLGGGEVVTAQLAHLSRYRVPLAVALLDIDRFKQRNDQLGHAAGDHALRAIVAALHGDLRETDRLVRWGGDELLIVLPATTITDARTSARRWRQLVGDLGLAADTDRVLTVSVGLAEAHADDDLDALVRRADRAMYRAKDDGGDRVELAVAHPAPVVPRDLRVARSLAPLGDERSG